MFVSGMELNTATGTLSTKCLRKMATFSCPVKCRGGFVLLMSLSSVWVYTTHPGGELHFRLKQNR